MNGVSPTRMDGFQLEIARFLVGKAMRKSRVTYQQVGEAVGWGHQYGRGLGSHLEVILHDLADQGLPPLTTILVKKGKRHPADDAMAYIKSALGDIDIEAAQQQAFAFDWTTVPDLAPRSNALPGDRDVWLTSFWGFAPNEWGCIGFSDEARRERFLKATTPGVLVAIYVTKHKGTDNERGQVVGVLEISHERSHARDFISGEQWALKEADSASRGKWLYALRATRAWRIVPEDWMPVGELFLETYTEWEPQFIGASGVQVTPGEADALRQLEVYEVPVYGVSRPVDSTIMTLETALSPSRAVPPALGGYWVGETDGPKHLYILTLKGDLAVYLGEEPADVAGKQVIKVGFSKSPLARRDQIQSAYPAGTFRWLVSKPTDPCGPAPYSCAKVAIAGEDAMKARLVDEKARSLGGEFFLADDWLVHSTWAAGQAEAQKAEVALGGKPGIP